MFDDKQLTERSDLPSSLQMAIEKRPKFARTTSRIWETAPPSWGHSMLSIWPSHAYDVSYDADSRFRGTETEMK